MIRRKKLKNASKEELEYIRNRYSDSESDSESLKRLYYRIEVKPKCPVCGKYVNFIGMPSKMFTSFCSPKCAQNSNDVRDKLKKTCLERYGVINGGGSKQALDKIKKTCQEKYGVNWIGQISSQKEHVKETFIKKYGGNPNKTKQVRDKLKKTCLKRYGVINGGGSKQALDKIKETCQEKYGVDSIFKLDIVKKKIKQTNIERYGTPFPTKNEKIKEKLKVKLNTLEVKEKAYNTKKKNHSFNTSKDEKISYLYLSIEYPDTMCQVRYSKYENYIADFYIPCLDLYIECDYHWTHGGHMFDENNINDIKQVELWKSKHTKYYDNAVYNWMIKDIKKDNFIHQNNLKCLHFYSLFELIKWLK